jgi:hypothetical protein
MQALHAMATTAGIPTLGAAFILKKTAASK